MRQWFSRICRNITSFSSMKKRSCSRNKPDFIQQQQSLQHTYMQNEACILVDSSDKVLGHASKEVCHELNNGTSPLHRAFSLFLFRQKPQLQLLIQRRSSFKLTYPRMWSNTCCSHPNANRREELLEVDEAGVRHAARRKIEHELGICPNTYLPLDNISFLTRILYAAANEYGERRWAEHELDYVLVSVLDRSIDTENGMIDINPGEVSESCWIDKEQLENIFDRSNACAAAAADDCSLGPQQGLDFTPWFRGLVHEGHMKRIWQWVETHCNDSGNATLLDALWDRRKIHRLQV